MQNGATDALLALCASSTVDYGGAKLDAAGLRKRWEAYLARWPERKLEIEGELVFHRLGKPELPYGLGGSTDAVASPVTLSATSGIGTQVGDGGTEVVINARFEHHNGAATEKGTKTIKLQLRPMEVDPSERTSGIGWSIVSIRE